MVKKCHDFGPDVGAWTSQPTVLRPPAPAAPVTGVDAAIRALGNELRSLTLRVAQLEVRLQK